jgi:hypothetical protein
MNFIGHEACFRSLGFITNIRGLSLHVQQTSVNTEERRRKRSVKLYVNLGGWLLSQRK